MTTADLSPSDRCAATIPLVTVFRFEDLSKWTSGHLPITRPKCQTRETEEALGLPASRYFYAGRAHPQFGDSVFVYDASVEGGHTGSVNPFDTGGVYRGHIHPFCGIDVPSVGVRGKALVDSTRYALDVWRTHFSAFLAAAFALPVEYFTSAPSPRATFGPSDLPAWDKRNCGDPKKEWRAWTWEVRLHERHEVSTHLQFWGCHPAISKLIDDACTSGALPPLDGSSGWLDNLRAVCEPLVGDSFCVDVEAQIRANYE